ncbi:MAG: sugar-binding protein, partial [Candidatus Hinthialibacter sp.]
DNSNFVDRDTSGSNPEIVDTGGQFVITTNNAVREAEAGNPGYGPDAAWYAQCDWTDTGYDAEFRISLDTIGNPQRGDIIGFTIAVNDDDTGGGADNQYTWVGRTHEEVTYGNLILGKRSYEAPKAAAPTVDGVIQDNEYDGAEPIVVNCHTGVYSGSNDTWELGDHDFTAWVVHDSDAVYVAVDVTDDLIITDSADPGSENGSTWTDDSVEIFFDADNNDSLLAWMNDEARPSGFYEGQFVMTANGAYRHAEAGNPTFGVHWNADTSLTSSGYLVEFQVMKSALGDPADGTTMGFHIAVNDDDQASESPKTQIGWNSFAHLEYTYGDLILGGETPVAEWALY